MAEERMLITGGQRLEGTVRVSGGKNTSVAVISASILSETPCVIENLPNIEDVNVSVETLRHLGAKVNWDPDAGVMEVDSSTIDRTDVPLELCRRMRASSYYIGALLARFGRAQVPLPGGCDIGRRPIDQHIKGMRALGAKVETTRGLVVAQTDGLIGSDVFMDMVTVGGTINVMLAASRAKGITTIYNAAKEPHIVDLANFLNSMGCRVKGAGTDVIRIRGVDTLQCRRPYAVIPDQIEAGTFMIAAAATRGDVLVKNVIPKHLEPITSKLRKIGVNIEEFDDSVRVWVDGPLVRTNVKTMPHPGFPTDMQPQITTLLTLAEGTSIITEGVWEQRFRYVDELRRMGADISVDGKVAVVEGTGKLTGAPVKACDLRAGAALIIAGLAAHGITEIEDIYHIERGYANLDAKLRLEMRYELQRLHVETGSTFVYVTHDQMEAMTLATQICLINNGVLQQYQAPLEVYHHPANLFVADFVGNPSINFVEAKGAQAQDGSIDLTVLGGLKAKFRPAKPMQLADWFAARDEQAANRAAALKEKASQKGYVEKGNKDEVFRYHIAKVNEEDDSLAELPEITNEDFVLGIRPEFIDIADEGKLRGEIYGAMPTGMESTIKVRVGGFLLTGVVFGSSLFTISAEVPLSVTGDQIMLFDRKSGQCITSGSLTF